MGLRDLRSETAAMRRAQLGQAGISRREVGRLVENGHLLRLRKGSFTITGRLTAEDDYGRHRLLVEDVARSVGGTAVVSHFSAAVLLGLPIPSGTDLRAVHLTWPGASGRGRTTNITPHRAVIELEDVTKVDGIAVTSVARTVYDLARSEDQLVSVSVADAALAAGACDKADFDDVVERSKGRRGSVMAWQVMTFADGRAAGDLHSKVRVVFARLGLPIPELATTICDPDPMGPIDFEFGKFRTVALVPNNDRPAWKLDDLAPELESRGWRVCRVDELDLASPALLLKRISRAFDGADKARWNRRPPILLGAPKSIWQY